MGQSFQDHFSAVAERYAGFRPHYPAALFDYLATQAPSNCWVWDCACGSGQATLDLAARFEKVIGTDASGEQISKAPAHPRVEYRVATAEQSGLPDGSIGLITVAQALHWFDLDRFYNEAKRVLSAGGVIAAWAYGVNSVEDKAVDPIVHDYYENVVGPYWPPERKLVEQGYRSVPFPFSEIEPPAFQMEADWALDQVLGYFSTWSATNRYVRATGKDPLKPLRAAMERVWGDPGSPKRIRWPLALRLGRKEA